MAEVENNENLAFVILMYAFMCPLVASLKVSKLLPNSRTVISYVYSSVVHRRMRRINLARCI